MTFGAARLIDVRAAQRGMLVLSSLATSALVALSVPLSILVGLGVAAGAALLWLVAAPLSLSLGTFLTARGVTDALDGSTNGTVADMLPNVGFGALNMGALMGLLAIALMFARLVHLRRGRGVATAILIAAALAVWSAVGVAHFGFAESIYIEYIRSMSIVAVALIAANWREPLSGSSLARIIVIAALVPALSVVIEAALRWGEFTGGGSGVGFVKEDLRPRGTMSHPNSAAVLFGISATIALWKWAFDGRLLRYLLAVGLFVLAILATRSIGGLLQVSAALAVFSLAQEQARRLRPYVFLASVVLLAQFILDPFGFSRAEVVTSASLTNAGGSSNSFEWRLLNWERLIDEWEKQPVMGYGLGATTDQIRPLRSRGQGGLPHSDPIRLLVETGVVGFVLFGTAWLLLLRRLYGRSRDGPNASFIAAVLATAVGVTVHGLATHASLNTGPMYVLAALLGATLTMSYGASAAAREPAEAPSTAEEAARRAQGATLTAP